MTLVKEKYQTGTNSNRSECKAATIAEPGVIRIEKMEVKSPEANEILIELEGCGLCSSNLSPFIGREWFTYPLEKGSPGHEGWGVVQETGQNIKSIKTGDRVSIISDRQFAEYVTVKETLVKKLPATLNGKHFPGEPLACAMNIFDRSDIQQGQTVCIIGAGFLGCLLTQLAKTKKARVITISKRESSLFMSKVFGADIIIPYEDHISVIKRIQNLTDGKFCDRVIEATGKQNPLELAGELTAVRGRLIIAGYHQDGMREINMQLWNWRGIDVINAHERDPEKYQQGMDKAIKAIEDGEMDPYPLFTHTYSLENIQLAFETLKARPEGFTKALIMMS